MPIAPDRERACPKCGAILPVYFQFRTWCDRCEWNLDEEFSSDPPKGLFPRIYTWLNRRTSERLFKEALKDRSLKSKFGISALIAVVISTLVHLVTLSLVLIFIWLTVQTLFDIINKAPAILWIFKLFAAVLVFLLIRKIGPRFGKLPKQFLSRTSAPALFVVLDRISAALSTRQVDAVILTPQFNAGIGHTGLRQQVTLVLGLPFIFSLDRQELAALLGHELAHQVNGDPNQTQFIRQAVHTLSRWFDLLNIRKLLVFGGMVGFLALILQIVIWVLGSVFWVLTVLLSLLLFPLMQRSEYLADGIAASLAGSKAAEQLLYKSQLGDAYKNLLIRAAQFPEITIFETILKNFPLPPEREINRIQKVIAKGLPDTDPTHPSTYHRLMYLKNRPSEPGQIGISDSEYTRIIDELLPYHPEMETNIRKALTQNQSIMA